MVDGFGRRDEHREFSFRCPLPLFPCTPLCQLPVGVHIFKTSPLQESGHGRREHYISVTEIKAVQHTLNTFVPWILGESVVLMSASTTLMAYLKKQGGSLSRVMCSLAQEVIAWSELYLMTLCVRYVRGKKNILAIQLSHPDQVLPAKWSVLPWVFGAICKVYGRPLVDLFAIRTNTKFPSYGSLVLDPMTWK